MKIAEESRWQQQRAELLADKDFGKEVLAFLETWADLAEKSLAEETSDPMAALRLSLPATETALGYRLPIQILGGSLVALIANWFYGEQMFDGMTEIEKRFVAEILEAIQVRVAEMAES